MAETINSAHNNPDEIDPLKVLERTLSYLGKYKIWLLILAVTGTLCGSMIYLALPKTYASKLILHSQILNNSEEIEIISNWATLLRSGEYGVLSKNFNCSPELFSKIKYLKAEEIPTPGSGPALASGFSIDVLVTDTAILSLLQKAIIYGLENNEYVSAKVEIRRENTLKIIDDLNREIAKLDSTKKKIETSNGGKAPGSSSFIMDISNVNVQMIDLNEKLYQNQENLKFIDAIQVFQKFEKYTKPDSPRLLTLLISGFLGGLLSGYLLIIYKYLSQKIAIIRNDRKNS